MMHVSARGLALIEGFEGWSARPYWDSYGGVWTRGYGETEGITARSPAITRAQGEANLRRRLELYYEPVIRGAGGREGFNQNQWDALCSIAWNLGVGTLAVGNPLGEFLRERRFADFAKRLLAYDHAGGVELAGLKRRRELEAQLFLQAPAPYVPADEARWIHEWDTLGRSLFDAIRRRALRRRMLARRREIWTRANSEPSNLQAGAGWQRYNRRARYEALLARTRP